MADVGSDAKRTRKEHELNTMSDDIFYFLMLVVILLGLLSNFNFRF